MDTTRKPRLIGLYSPAPQSGKSTVSDHLFTTHGFNERHFATGLKAMVKAALAAAGFSQRRIGELETVDKLVPMEQFGGKTYRDLAQTVGTEWGRKCITPDLWVNLALPNAPLSDTVVDDVRFPNEFQRIRKLGGEVWMVMRPGATRPNEHASEGLLDYASFDRVIVNNGSLKYLYAQVDVSLR